MSNCFAEACGYDSHNRQRGSGEPDAPLVLKLDSGCGEVDVVMGGIQGNQTNHQAAQELNPALAVGSEESELSMRQVWRKRSDLAGTPPYSPERFSTPNPATAAAAPAAPPSDQHQDSPAVGQGRLP